MDINEGVLRFILINSLLDGVLSSGDSWEPERCYWLSNPPQIEGDSGQTQGRGTERENHDLERLCHRRHLLCWIWTGEYFLYIFYYCDTILHFTGVRFEIIFRGETTLADVWTSLKFYLRVTKSCKKVIEKLWFWTVQLYGLNCYYSNIFQTVSAVYLFVIDWMMVKLSEWDSFASNVFRNVKLISIVIFSSLWFELLVYKYLSGFNESLNGMGPFCTLNQFRRY